jgi:hypothetical protein
MINERMCLFWRRIRQAIGIAAQEVRFQAAAEKDFGMSGMTAFLVAVGGVSIIGYWLKTRVQNRSPRRSSASDGSSNDYSYNSGGGGWNIASWFSSDNSSSDSSGASGSGDGGGSETGGGGDSGGGGDGGGGGD